jgi:hypothetical protein
MSAVQPKPFRIVSKSPASRKLERTMINVRKHHPPLWSSTCCHFIPHNATSDRIGLGLSQSSAMLPTFHKEHRALIFGWLQRRRKQTSQARLSAQELFDAHTSRARYALREQIQDLEATGPEAKRLWAIMRELRKIDGSDGLDTATRFIERQ